MRFVINGGRRLEGAIAVSGSKNAATPTIAATILTEQPCRIENVPRIGDVETMLALLASMGAEVRWAGEHEVAIVNRNLDPTRLDQRLVGQIRSSILLAGPLLARFGAVELAAPGGCRIGSRPIDTHLAAFRAAGALVETDAGTGRYRLALARPSPAEVVLREFSVTATENLLLLGARVPLTVKLAAEEPHVQDLCRFLARLGLTVRGVGTHTLTTRGDAERAGAGVRHRLITDEIEAGTFAVLAAATRSRLAVSGAPTDSLDAALEKLREVGVVVEARGEALRVDGPAASLRAAKIETRPYPGLPTDLQAPFGVLATQATGTSLVFDTLYEGRLRYLEELKKMGADATVLDPHRALVTGPTVLHGTAVAGLDLRAGATLVIAALVAQGESTLEGAEQIDRGYERLDERLRGLGADIRRV